MSGPAFFQKEEVKSDTLFKVDCKFALKESFFDWCKGKQNIVICSFLNRYLLSDK